MIEIEAVLEPDGILRSCRVSGHAKAGKKGEDIVCSAVSVLMRTALHVLSGRKGIRLKGGASERGKILLEAEYDAEGKDFLYATGVFLIDGLSSVAEEFPQNCKLNIVTWRN